MLQVEVVSQVQQVLLRGLQALLLQVLWGIMGLKP
jgi:hypothetical protein